MWLVLFCPVFLCIACQANRIPNPLMSNSTRSEVIRFLFVGTATVLIDLLFYRLCFALGMWVHLAKGLGFIAGSLFAYFANKSWTFKAEQGGVNVFMRFVLVYGINLGCNVGINSAILHMLGMAEWSIQLAFFVATGFSATMNFLGMKIFVFTSLDGHQGLFRK